MKPHHSQKFQFAGPPTPRAKPIPREKWEEHKEKLGSLYQEMKLDDLMVTMKDKYGFAPT